MGKRREEEGRLVSLFGRGETTGNGGTLKGGREGTHHRKVYMVTAPERRSEEILIPLEERGKGGMLHSFIRKTVPNIIPSPEKGP